jgi:hypothetical protein
MWSIKGVGFNTRRLDVFFGDNRCVELVLQLLQDPVEVMLTNSTSLSPRLRIRRVIGSQIAKLSNHIGEVIFVFLVLLQSTLQVPATALQQTEQTGVRHVAFVPEGLLRKAWDRGRTNRWCCQLCPFRWIPRKTGSALLTGFHFALQRHFQAFDVAILHSLVEDKC